MPKKKSTGSDHGTTEADIVCLVVALNSLRAFACGKVRR